MARLRGRTKRGRHCRASVPYGHWRTTTLTEAIKARFEALAPHLNESARRLFVASEAHAAGRGGVTAVAEVTGVALRRRRNSTRILIIADCGGSNGARVRLWKTGLQTPVDQTGLSITVAHLPPGTRKWNRIEHRLFAFITQNWRGKPLPTHQVIVQRIASTTTDKGRTVQCRLDENIYDKGIKVSDAEMATLNIRPSDFHGEWNSTIQPRKPDN